MHEMGYDYLRECEKTCRVLHFLSLRDKGKQTVGFHMHYVGIPVLVGICAEKSLL